VPQVVLFGENFHFHPDLNAKQSKMQL